MTTVHVKDLPHTPQGKNKDISGLDKDSYIRLSENIEFKVSAVVSLEWNNASDTDSDNGNNDEPLLSSPLIERRKSKNVLQKKKKNVEIESVFQSVGNDLHDMYEQNKDRSMSREKDFDKENRRSSIRLKTLNSSVHLDENENVDNMTEITTCPLIELENAIIDSKNMLDNDKIVFTSLITKWKEFLQKEDDKLSEEVKGEINTIIGQTELLLKKRFNSTMYVINQADEYYKNGGKILSDSGSVYKASDVYSFVDVLKLELTKCKEGFDKLDKRRNNDWKYIPEKKVAKGKRSKVAQKPVEEKEIKSKLNIRELKKAAKSLDKNVDSNVDNVEIYEGPVTRRKSRLIQSSEDQPKTPEMIKNKKLFSSDQEKPGTPKNMLIRDKYMIRSVSGTPIHRDTPRPSKSFVTPHSLPKKRNQQSSGASQPKSRRTRQS